MICNYPFLVTIYYKGKSTIDRVDCYISSSGTDFSAHFISYWLLGTIWRWKNSLRGLLRWRRINGEREENCSRWCKCGASPTLPTPSSILASSIGTYNCSSSSSSSSSTSGHTPKIPTERIPIGIRSVGKYSGYHHHHVQTTQRVNAIVILLTSIFCGGGGGGWGDRSLLS